MLLRYVLTMTFHPEMRWLGGTIPIFFHFVLAGFIFVLGRYHSVVNGRPDHQRPLVNHKHLNQQTRHDKKRSLRRMLTEYEF